MKLYQVSYHISPSMDTLGELYSSEEEAIKEKDFIMQDPKKYLGSGNFPVNARIIKFEVLDKFDSNTVQPVY